ncbi:NAD(P)-binding protein [Astrocystis sublimbata]|nr:NAD(P)-binding protein [Astrocystis sublimbata]
MSPRQQFVLVTGCGKGGIGEGLVVEFARRGLHSIATVLPFEDRNHLIEAGITCYELDVTNEQSIGTLKSKITDLTGGYLDILVNNAGIAYTMTAIDTDVKEVEDMFNVNVFGPMRMVRSLHDMLIRSTGTIVNIGSIGGIVPYVYGAAYNGSKAALQHWSNTLRVEMAPFDVKVLTIISGEVETNILKRDKGRELPKDSYYSPLADAFKRHVQRIPDSTNRFVYAKHVVAQSLKSSPPAWYWYGNATLSIRFLTSFGWGTIWDWIFWNMFDLKVIKQYYSQKEKRCD